MKKQPLILFTLVALGINPLFAQEIRYEGSNC